MKRTSVFCLYFCYLSSILFLPLSQQEVIKDGKCTSDEQCGRGMDCVNNQCVASCRGVCGPNTVCVLQNLTPVCSCQRGYIGDPVVECKPEHGQCKMSADCPLDMICLEQQCIDPCHSEIFGGCKSNSACHTINHRPICACFSGYYYTEFGCQPFGKNETNECKTNDDCEKDKSCINGKCVDPCEKNPCGVHTNCAVKDHTVICTCKDGYVRNDKNECVLPCSTTVGNKTYVKTFSFDGSLRMWPDALRSCKSKGMDLATIMQECEWNDLLTAYRSSGRTGSSFWIGGHDFDFSYYFFWVLNGREVDDTFSLWRTPEKEPSKANKHCLLVNHESLTMRSWSCKDDRYYYACQTVTLKD